MALDLTPDQTRAARKLWLSLMGNESISHGEWLAIPVDIRNAVMTAMKTASSSENPFEEKLPASATDANEESAPISERA